MTELSGKPGAGLPGFENFYLNIFFKIGSAVTSDKSALRQFQITTQEILRIADDNDLGLLSQRMKIPRLQGIESSSCHWSVLMVLEHLNQVNKTIVEIIRALKNGNEPFVKVQIADFKPDPEFGVEAIEDFREGNKRYWAFVQSHMPLRTNIGHRHPWFGEIDGHQWHVLATAHQKMHLRQIYKIMAMIGVV